MRISDVMTTRVEGIQRERTLREAAERMRVLNVGSLPVLDRGDKVIGIVTDRDIVIRAIAVGRDPGRTSVAEVMSEDVVACAPEDSIESAAELMKARQIRRILVCDAQQKLVGIVALADLATEAREENLSEEVIEAVSEPAPLV